MKSMTLIAALALCCPSPQDAPDAVEMPAPAGPVEQHAWLEQMLGEWTVKSAATMVPGAEPMMFESTESVRSIGGLWIMAEGKGEFMGTAATTMLTLGYDPAKGHFIGTWIDSMQTHMWIYEGHLDEAKKVLTLETTGPSFTDPSQMAPYKDVIEIIDADHKRLTSHLQGDDGAWVEFMRADYTRRPAAGAAR